MKTLFYKAVIITAILCGAASAQKMSLPALPIRIAGASHSGNITIDVSNPSKEPIRIWKESNSWGAARWRVLLIRKAELKVFFQNPNQLFTKNNPSFDEIDGGAHIIRKLDMNGRDWCDSTFCALYDERRSGDTKVTLEPGDIVIVTYDVPRTNESGKLGVWYGVSAAFTTIH